MGSNIPPPPPPLTGAGVGMSKYLASELRAKGMLIYRIMSLHKALVSLFLVQRPIVGVFTNVWNKIQQILNWKPKPISNIAQLLNWLKEDKEISTDTNSLNQLMYLYPYREHTQTEYNNLNRDLLELIAPLYEVNSDRKLATAARMRNSYQCLAPPSS